MGIANAESKASRVRRGQEIGRDEVDSDLSSGIGYPSPEVGNQSIAVRRTDRTGIDSRNAAGRTTGKIVRQLIDEVREQLAESKKATIRLERLMIQLENLEQLLQETQEPSE